MAAMRKVTYSLKPWLLGDLIYLHRTSRGDFEAILKVLESRSDLTAEEIFAMDLRDLAEVLRGLNASLEESQKLQTLGDKL